MVFLHLPNMLFGPTATPGLGPTKLLAVSFLATAACDLTAPAMRPSNPPNQLILVRVGPAVLVRPTRMVYGARHRNPPKTFGSSRNRMWIFLPSQLIWLRCKAAPKPP